REAERLCRRAGDSRGSRGRRGRIECERAFVPGLWLVLSSHLIELCRWRQPWAELCLTHQPSTATIAADQMGGAHMFKTICGAVVSAHLLLAGAAFAADSYPTRPVRFIVPGAPGSGTDRVARLVADRLTQAWPQNALV